MRIFWPIVFLGLMLAVGIYNFASLITEAGRSKLGIVILAFSGLCSVPSFYAVTNFAAAEPASLIRASGYDVPAEWAAGVLNHGTYYRWYLIADHPVLFALSVGVFAASVVALVVLILYSMWERNEHTAAEW